MPPTTAATLADKAKRMAISAEVADASKLKSKPVVPKSADVSKRIKEIVSHNLLFENLREGQVDDLISRMFEFTVKAGDIVIKQGDEGDNFYVIFEGDYAIEVKGSKVGNIGPGKCFGELALMYNSPRAATIKATGPGKLWAMDRMTYRAITLNSAAAEAQSRIAALRSSQLLADLDAGQLARVAAAMSHKSARKGEAIIRKGEPGENFYVLVEGSVVVGDNVATLRKGATFGERALLTNEPRDATITAAEDCQLLVLGRNEFQDMLGPLEDVWKVQVLSRADILAPLSQTQRAEVVRLFKEVSYPAGAAIFKKGDDGDTFFVVEKGTVDILDPKAADPAHAKPVSSCKRCDYFGERSLVLHEKRAATAVANGPVVLLQLAGRDFEKYLEPLKETLKARAAAYERAAGDQSAIRMDDLKEVGVLGVGSFGFVRMMVHKATGDTYALKALKKEQILATQQQDHIVNEKNVLRGNVQCDFLGSCHATFQDTENLFMLMPLLAGGELFSFLRREQYFEEPMAKFYAAHVILGLENLHSRRIVFRDLKPENILMGADGYLRIIDFGFAKEIRGTTYTLCGTPDYLAPEIIGQKGHDFGVDWWTMGVLIFEMVNGYTPFYDDDVMQMYAKIRRGDMQRFRSSVSKECQHLVGELLAHSSSKRLGMRKGGVDDIKNHPWFKDLDWKKVQAKQIKAPYIPPIKAKTDMSNFDQYSADDNPGNAFPHDPSHDYSWCEGF